MPASWTRKRKANAPKTGRYSSDIRVACKFCQRECDPRGLPRHQKSCQAERELDAFYEENRKRAAEADLHRTPKCGRLARQADPPSPTPGPSRELLGGSDIESNESDSVSDHQILSGPHNVHAEPLSIPDDDDAFQHSDVNNSEMPPTPLPLSAPLFPTAPSPPTRDDIKVEYHKNSGRSRLTVVYPFEEYKQEKRKADPELLKETAWHPFASRMDFEVAAFAHDAHLSGALTARLLALIKDGYRSSKEMTFERVEDVHNAWERANLHHAPFQTTNMEVKYKDITEPFEFHHRSLWDWILYQVKDPLLAPHFEWDAQRLSKFDGQQWVRFYDEPWTGTMFAKAQSEITKMDPTGKPLSIILWADTAKLSNFGKQKGHFIVARIGNLPAHIRNGGFLGGGRIVGFIPIVEENAQHSKKTKFVNFKNAVYHSAFKEFLKDIARHSKVGYHYRCGDNILRTLFPFINIISADYEEQVRFALIRGLRSLAPCPICIIPKGTLSDLSVTYSLRSASKTETLIKQPHSAQKNQILKIFGLRDIPNAFWDVANSDVHEALSFDRLHAYIIGLWQKHLLQQLKLLVEELPREARVRIEERLSRMPRWEGLAHFDGEIFKQDFSDGKKWEDLSKVLLHAVYGPIMKYGGPKGYALLKVIRKWIELNALVALEVQTEKTIAAFEQTLSQFDEQLKAYGNTSGINKDWDAIIKTHSHTHAVRDIRAKGVIANMDTKPNEKLNREMRLYYQLMTNFKSVEKQLGNLEDRSFVSSTIHAHVTAWDEHCAKSKAEPNEVEERSSPWQFNQVYLGSRERLVSIHEFTMQNEGDTVVLRDPAFHKFKQKLSKCLADILSRDRGEERVSVSIVDEDKVVECKYLKVDYESTVSWRLLTDRLRCSPLFHRRPRYDNVLVDLDGSLLVFCELVRVFTYTLNDNVYGLALVHPYHSPSVSPQIRQVDR
ncbi:hypothetical protein BDW22DRAFT_1479807, partial [Trametopsis cervina]